MLTQKKEDITVSKFSYLISNLGSYDLTPDMQHKMLYNITYYQLLKKFRLYTDKAKKVIQEEHPAFNQLHAVIEDEMNTSVYNLVSTNIEKVHHTINIHKHKVCAEEYFNNLNYCIFTTNLDGFEKLRIPWMVKNHFIHKYQKEDKHDHKSCMIEKVTIEDSEVISGKSVNLTQDLKMEQKQNWIYTLEFKEQFSDLRMMARTCKHKRKVVEDINTMIVKQRKMLSQLMKKLNLTNEPKPSPRIVVD